MKRRGTILVMVLIVTALTAMVTAAIMYQAQAAAWATSGADVREQAHTAAWSGLQRVIAILQESPDDPSMWQDAPDLLAEQLVGDDGVNQWYFTVYAPNRHDPAAVRNGVTDESSLLNVNTVPEEALAEMGILSDEQIDSLLDYREPGDEPRPMGAKQDWYNALPRPYRIKNAPLIGSLEELLLVRGFTAATIYGEDANLNGLLDPNEDDGDETFPPDNADGQLDRGLRAWATAISWEPNVTGEGEPRVNINGSNSQLRRLEGTGLPRETIAFIQAYRAAGNMFTHPAELLNMTFEAPESARGGAGRPGGGRPGGGGGSEPRQLSSGVGPDELAMVLDTLTTIPEDRRLNQVRGLVNVNTASAEVLACLPGLGAEAASRIADMRASVPLEDRRTIAWLFTHEVLDEETFKVAAPMLTARGFQYRVLVVGYGVPSGRFCVLEAVVDFGSGTGRISYLRDLTELGMPFPLLTGGGRL